MLRIEDLTYRIAGRTLLENATATVPDGHKVALVGPNGTGKTTLFRLIAGEIGPDQGRIEIGGGQRLGIVAQEAPEGEASLLDTVLAADRERTDLLAEADIATDPQRIADIHARLAAIEAAGAPSRAATILAGLGFDEAAQARPVGSYSGGWRMRVALAAALFARPDILLLDEPTNHLDLEAATWLEGYLQRHRGTILMISHDREILNAIPDTIVHLDQGQLVTYRGNYDSFVRQRQERLMLQSAAYAKQVAARQRIQAFVDRFRAKASKARQAQSRLKMLERMEPLVPVVETQAIRFDFPSPAPLPPPLVTLEGVKVGYGGAPVLSGLDLRIDADDRIALLGANGNGKSTLVKLLAGQLQPMAGQINRSGKLKVGYFAQHQTDALDIARSALAVAQTAMPLLPEEKVRAHLGRFGFSQTRADTRVADLSGGEKARLLFALATRDAPHIMLLDEPTNHLDVESRDALVEALNAYDGAVILVTHDPHMIELVADRLWLVAKGAVRPFDGDLAEYRQLLVQQRRAEAQSAAGPQTGGPDRRAERRQAAERRAELAPLRRKVDTLEKEIARLSREIAALDAKLADPALYAGPADAVTKLQIARADLGALLAQAEERWLETASAYEDASNAA